MSIITVRAAYSTANLRPQYVIYALEEITPRLERIRNRIKRVEQEYTLLEEEKHREQKQLQLIEQFSTFQAKFSSRLDALTFDEKQQVVRLLVEEVLVDSVNEKLTVKHVIPLDKSFPLRSGSTVPLAFKSHSRRVGSRADASGATSLPVRG